MDYTNRLTMGSYHSASSASSESSDCSNRESLFNDYSAFEDEAPNLEPIKKKSMSVAARLIKKIPLKHKKHQKVAENKEYKIKSTSNSHQTRAKKAIKATPQTIPEITPYAIRNTPSENVTTESALESLVVRNILSIEVPGKDLGDWDQYSASKRIVKLINGYVGTLQDSPEKIKMLEIASSLKEAINHLQTLDLMRRHFANVPLIGKFTTDIEKLTSDILESISASQEVGTILGLGILRHRITVEIKIEKDKAHFYVTNLGLGVEYHSKNGNLYMPIKHYTCEISSARSILSKLINVKMTSNEISHFYTALIFAKELEVTGIEFRPPQDVGNCCYRSLLESIYFILQRNKIDPNGLQDYLIAVSQQAGSWAYKNLAEISANVKPVRFGTQHNIQDIITQINKELPFSHIAESTIHESVSVPGNITFKMVHRQMRPRALSFRFAPNKDGANYDVYCLLREHSIFLGEIDHDLFKNLSDLEVTLRKMIELRQNEVQQNNQEIIEQVKALLPSSAMAGSSIRESNSSGMIDFDFANGFRFLPELDGLQYHVFCQGIKPGAVPGGRIHKDLFKNLPELESALHNIFNKACAKYNVQP